MAIKGSGTIVPRNPVVRSPLMRKGGAHEKSKTAKRRQNSQALKSQLEDWREELEFERSLRSNSEQAIRILATLEIIRSCYYLRVL